MLKRTIPASAALSCLCLAAASLSTAHPGQKAREEGKEHRGDDERAVPVHLSEHLSAARIESPLTGLEPAADVSDLEDAAIDLLLEEGFEGFDWDFADWPRLNGVTIAKEGDGELLRIEGPLDRSGALGWILPVQPDCFYRFRRSVRVVGEPFCDLYVVESLRDFEDARLSVNAHFLAGRGDALKVHSLPLRSGKEVDGTWQEGTTSFYPTPRTRSLVVLVRPRVGDHPEATVRTTSFDDVVLEEVLPTKVERMRLLKGAYPASNADPALGLRKAGYLLPLPSPGGRQEGEASELNYTWRQAIYAPPGTELAFDLADLPVPTGARLVLGTGLARETPRGSQARFQVDLVSADGAREPERLLDAVRTATMDAWEWKDVELDLAGRTTGTLVLRTLAEKGDPHPLWGDPHLVPAATEKDPLVILIAVDTLRADRLSGYGYERETSPALDRLAAEGVRFDQARSNCNWTCPSFASIFTGLVPSRHGVTSYGPATPLPDELVTLAEHFRAFGWSTRSIAYKVPLFDGNYEQGFDQAFNIPRDFIRGEENLARALEWLDAPRGGPAFLFLHFNDPHQPFVQPEPYDRSYGPPAEELGIEMPPGVPSIGQDEHVRLFRDLYDGAVSYVDACIGRFLDAMRERGLYEHATVAFVADHGEQLWEHGRFGHGGEHLYDEIVRVPLIVKPPAGSFEPRVVRSNVSGFDVMPTLLEIAGIPPAVKLDARSLMPLIRGEEDPDRVVVTETSRDGLSLVHGDFKLVVEPGTQAELLFDLRNDPKEETNLAAERPEVVSRLRHLVIEYLLEHRPGNYLLVRSGDEPARLRVSTLNLRPWVGPSPSFDPSSTPPLASVDLAGGAWALFEVEGQDASKVITNGLKPRGSTRDFEPWSPGGFKSLTEAGIWRVKGPEGRQPLGANPDTVDAELLEALRRLGYVE